jgi:hypothetical protein
MTINEGAIAAALQQAPAWAKLGLSMRDARMRDAAMAELSRHLAHSLGVAEQPDDPRQLAFPV